MKIKSMNHKSEVDDFPTREDAQAMVKAYKERKQSVQSKLADVMAMLENVKRLEEYRQIDDLIDDAMAVLHEAIQDVRLGRNL